MKTCEVVMQHRFSKESLTCLKAIPSTLSIERSTSIGWTSLLAQYSQSRAMVEPYETHPTPDQLISIFAKGEVAVEVMKAGVWQKADHQSGSVRTRAANRTERLRWQPRSIDEYFEGFHLFVPQDSILEAAEHFRQPGRPALADTLSAAAFKDDVLKGFAQTLLVAMRSGYPELYAETSAQWLAVHLLASHSGSAIRNDSRRPGFISDARLARTVEYIDTHLTSGDVDLATIANEAGVSKFHLIRLFREKMGETPVEYLMNRRVSLAAKMLVNCDLPIKQIAQQCGYTNISHFNARFRRRFAMSPSTYRQGRKSSE